MAVAVEPKLQTFEIEIISGPHLGERFSFSIQNITIGRGTENQIVLGFDPRVSRIHAEIKQEDGHFILVSTSSKNPALVNGQRVDSYRLAHNSKVRVGDTEFIFTIPNLAKIINPVPQALEVPRSASIQNPILKPLPGMASVMKSEGVGKIIPLPVLKASAQVPKPPKKKKNGPPKNQSGNQFILILIAAVILVIVFVLPSKKTADIPVTQAPIVEPALVAESRAKEALERAQEALNRIENQTSKQAMAQQFFISGMREFLNGNYHKAIQSLDSAYMADPTIAEAKKFRTEAQLKLDRMIDVYFSEGLKYRESGNFRMCKSSFSMVLLHIKGNLKHTRYFEAKQYYDECYNLDRARRF